MTLEETKDLMMSSNYKDRFRAEYWQLKIRYDRLCTALNEDVIALVQPKESLLKQRDCMKVYLSILQARSITENIEL